MSIRATIVLIAVILLSTTLPARAQYFGRNKVQYQRFDFKVLSSEHFDVYYYPQEEAAVRVATRQKLILYAAHPHFSSGSRLDSDHGRATETQRKLFQNTSRKELLSWRKKELVFSVSLWPVGDLIL